MLATGCAAVLALAACGSSGSKAAVTPGAPSPAANVSSNGTSAKPIVEIATTSKLGSVLVDTSGMTLYTLSNNGKPVPCSGACAQAWPPLVLPAGTTTAMGAGGVTGLSMMTGAGGTMVTENGAPLYRFKGDKAPGDTNGDGLASFGGVWKAATVATASTPGTSPAATAPTTPPTTSSSGGYGY